MSKGNYAYGFNVDLKNYKPGESTYKELQNVEGHHKAIDSKIINEIETSIAEGVKIG